MQNMMWSLHEILLKKEEGDIFCVIIRKSSATSEQTGLEEGEGEGGGVGLRQRQVVS